VVFKVKNIDTKILFACLVGLLNYSTVEINKIKAQTLKYGLISVKTGVLTGLNFIKLLRTDFMHADPICAKKTVKSAVSFGAFGTYERKSCK
jgi:hypothetical protein